jgi:hypothetical protein
MLGVPAVGESSTIGLSGKGFDPNGPPVIVQLDGVPIGESSLKVAEDGTISATVTLPDELERGEHLIEVRQGDGRDARSTTSILLKSEADDFEEEVESRFVDQSIGLERQSVADHEKGAS